jgi:D-psicose/D-tagatose/L-ribulose 3-epimerase
MFLVKRDSAYRRTLKEKADKEGILLSYGIGLDKEHDLSSMDESIRLNGVELMKKIVLSVEEMGGGLVSGTVHGYWPAVFPKGMDSKEPMLQQSLKSMRELAPFAEKHGVILNVEVINRFEQFLINTCDEALAYVNEINSPACNVLLDVFHMNIEEDSIGDAIRHAGKRLASLHLGEPNRKLPGMGSGRMPWAEIKKALDDIDYAGPLVMEPFIMKGGQIGRDIGVWRDLVKNPDLDALAAQSAEVVKKTLR